MPIAPPTLIQRMRALAATKPPAVPPWSTTDELYESVLKLMVAHRSDPAFWAAAKTMLEEARRDMDRAPSDQLLPAETIHTLLGDLQAALEDAPGLGGIDTFFSSRSGPQIAALSVLFALLAQGCASPSTQPAAEPSHSTATLAPSAETQTVGDASVPSDAATDPLIETFNDASPDVIAKKLETLLDGGKGSSPPPMPAPVYRGVSFGLRTTLS